MDLDTTTFKRRVQFHNHKTLEQAIAFAVEYEAFEGSIDEIRKPPGKVRSFFFKHNST